jgi:LysM repeat protein
MNTPNPLVPKGSKLEQKSNARSRVKLAVFFVLTIHVVGLMALLVQGCRPEEQPVVEPIEAPVIPDFAPVAIPEVDTNEVLLPVPALPPEESYASDEFPTAPSEVSPMELAVEEPITTAPAAVQQYAIQKGDTYYSIGKAYGVSMQAIKDANPGVDPTRLQVGQVITVPPTAPAMTDTVTPTASGEIIYTVVSGDNLSTIARKYGTTWQAIQDFNSLPTTAIKVGQKLRIPAPQSSDGTPPGGGL